MAQNIFPSAGMKYDTCTSRGVSENSLFPPQKINLTTSIYGSTNNTAHKICSSHILLCCLIHALFLLQTTNGQVKYKVEGIDPTTDADIYFVISETTGQISVSSSLNQDPRKAEKYMVTLNKLLFLY